MKLGLGKKGEACKRRSYKKAFRVPRKFHTKQGVAQMKFFLRFIGIFLTSSRAAVQMLI